MVPRSRPRARRPQRLLLRRVHSPPWTRDTRHACRRRGSWSTRLGRRRSCLGEVPVPNALSMACPGDDLPSSQA